MNLKKNAAQTAIAGALGLSALGLGVGAGVASADPPPPCWQQNCQGDNHRGDGGPQDDRGYAGENRQWGDQGRPGDWDHNQGWDQRPWDQRRIDDARFDHQPFNWQGQRVEPYWDQDRGAWGFWFLGVWIPL